MITNVFRWRNPFRRQAHAPQRSTAAAATQPQPGLPPANLINLNIAPDDPLVAYCIQTASAIELDRLNLNSPALHTLRAAGVELVIPLVSQGELLGLINLGSRLSDQAYNAEDRRMLTNLAVQAAPAVRLAELVQRQQAEALERERLEQEMRVARIIQETLLPKELPQLEGYAIGAFWQPARAVGGDFYDFVPFPDGRLAFIIGDVTDKGVPAALVMATTRSILRAAAERLQAPGDVLQRANDLLCPDMPPKMFVTCLIAVLDPASGLLRYANAGHDMPYHRGSEGVEDMFARGMPLGLLPGMTYEEKQATMRPGDTVVLYSDGIVEAHGAHHEMFGFNRLRSLVGGHAGGEDLIPFILEQLAGFTGRDWEQEDDVTIVTLQRLAEQPAKQPLGTQPTTVQPTIMQASQPAPAGDHHCEEGPAMGDEWRTLSEFSVPSSPGNERQVMRRVADIIADQDLPPAKVDRLKTAVAEATMNAMEHGNRYDEHLPVIILVQSSPTALRVRITDRGSDRPIPEHTAPDLDAKLAGQQSPRGWGLFLIRSMVDEMITTSDAVHHTVELVMTRDKEN